MSRITAVWQLLRNRGAISRVQLALCIRVTVAALLSFVLSHLLELPLALWAVLTAVILTQVSFGTSVKATIDYLVGTVGGAIYAGAIAAFVPHQNEIGVLAVLALAIAPLTLLAALTPSFSVAPVTAIMVLMAPSITHIGPMESAFYRVVEVALGGVTALVVSLLLLPTRAHALVLEAAAHTLDLIAQALPELFAGFTHKLEESAIRRIQDRIGQAVARLDAVAGVSRHERLAFLAVEFDPGPLLRTLLRLRHDLVMIGRAATVPLPEPVRARLEAPLVDIAERAASYLRGSAAALRARRDPPPLDELEQALDECTRAFGALRDEGFALGLPVDAVERIFALGFALEQLHLHLKDLERCTRECARQSSEPKAKPKSPV